MPKAREASYAALLIQPVAIEIGIMAIQRDREPPVDPLHEYRIDLGWRTTGLHELTSEINSPSVSWETFGRGSETNRGHLQSENTHGPPIGSLWMNSEW